MKKNKITIEIHSILKDVIRNIWVVILSGLIGFMGFYVVTHKSHTPVYTASAMLAVNAASNTSGSYSALTVSNEKANILVNIFTEPSVKECAAEYLGEDSFDGTVSASVMENTNFIDLRVTSDHPEKSYNLLNAIINSHHKVSDKIFRNAGVSVIRMPSMPSSPSNRIDNGNRSLVVIGFMTVSLAIILAISLMRNTIKKESDFSEKIESALIGTIIHENKRLTPKDILQKKKKGLLIHSNAYISLRFTENFHKIAAKLMHMKNQDGGKVLAITSVTENEGKSTCAANIAVSLADRGCRVALIDFDFKKPALFKIFGEESCEKSELSDLLGKKVAAEDFEFRTFKKTSLSLAINTKADSEYHSYIENGSVAELIDSLREKFDFIIVDTAPLSLDSTVTDILQTVDKAIMIIKTDTVIADAINDYISTISKISHNLAGCILNDVRPEILPFSFTGNDESGRYGYGYGKYSHYGYYGHYGKVRNRSTESKPAAEEAAAD